MTFAEIEQVIGEALPNSKAYAAWWSNNPSNNVMTKVWLEAGYRTEQVDTEGEKLVFRRDPTIARGNDKRDLAPARNQSKSPRRHPLFGVLKGKVTVLPETDLTAPADPTWGEQE